MPTARRPAHASTTQRLRAFFDAGVVHRGEAYLPRVEVQRRTPTRFVARVRGTQAYRTLLGRDPGRLSGRCTCPYFEGGPEPCKHLWATLRVAERMGWFDGVAPPKGLYPDLNLDESAAEPSPPTDRPRLAPPAAASERRQLGGHGLGADEGDLLDDDAADEGDLLDDEAVDESDFEAQTADEDEDFDGALDEAGAEDEFDEDDLDDDDDDVDDDFDLNDDELLALAPEWPPARSPNLRGSSARTGGPLSPSWQEALETARFQQALLAREASATTRLHYVLLPYELRGGQFYVHLATPPSRSRGEPPAPPSGSAEAPDAIELAVASSRARHLGADAHPVEAWLLALLRSSAPAYMTQPSAIRIEPDLFPQALRELCATGRCHFARRARHAASADFIASRAPVAWDGEAGAYRLEFALDHGTPHDGTPHDGTQPPQRLGRGFRLSGWLTRGGERLPLSEVLFIANTGLVAWPDRVAPLEPSPAFPLAVTLRARPNDIQVGEAELQTFVEKYHQLEPAPRLRLPPGFELTEVRLPPQPVLDVGRPDPRRSGLPARVSFAYGELRVPLGTPSSSSLDWRARCIVVRDASAETSALGELAALGVRPPRAQEPATVRIAAKKVPAIVRALLERGWRVEAEGKPYRPAGRFALKVSSGTDWFELGAELEFEGRRLPLPALLAALKNESRRVVLDDGSLGLLPEEWLARWGVLDGLGQLEGDRLRFRASELPLLNALIEGENQAEIDTDAAFDKLRRELERGARPQDRNPPARLRGELRPYQRDGLAWLRFLERSGFGGCLADDMGLGKTIQLLAHLAGRPRRGQRAPTGPALVVAPRSVLFNWEREAARFTPHLRVLTHWGPARTPPGPHFAEHDLVLTTYALLRIDQAELARQHFSVIVLDEAQAIKNADSHTARAARSLRADHRLALTGTPIENHLGELWSLFEFLVPGLLRHSKRLAQALSKSRAPDAQSAALIARAIRPFLLRRTKAQVAPELPERTEQTLYVELSPDERRHYDELASYYRTLIRKQIQKVGLERATPKVLEALLRLRQAACHPGLLDKNLRADGSAKLDLLRERLAEVIEGGHKALIFSQFTDLLAILRTELDRQGTPYEYLDGKTRRREQRVDRFQQDPELRLFLISLKAGGVGLNLTAADYVFILDPWWNPAAEAQAIDRAHRIGQTRHVVAYRLIAQGTVEEKVEALQNQKRELVQAILGDTAQLAGKLTREDLELLLA